MVINKQLLSRPILNALSFTRTPWIHRTFTNTMSRLEEENKQTPNVTSQNEEPRGRLLFLTLVRSHHHEPQRIRNVIHQMGLKRMHQLQVLQDTPHNRGLVFMTRHLLSVKGVSTAELFPQGTKHLDIGERLPAKVKSKLYFQREKKEKKEKQLKEAREYLDSHYGHFKYFS